VGGVLATVAVFAPPFVIVVAGAPFYHRFAKNRTSKAFVLGVTAPLSAQSVELPSYSASAL